jgi:site-specific DNA recombinase
MKAAIYIRVSTERQEENYSLSTQLEACRKYAKEHGFTVVAEFQDVESGATLDRPELNKLREMIRAGVLDAVIVYSLDRFSRNLAHNLLLRDELMRYTVALHYCNRGQASTTAEGMLFENIEAAFAEFERLRIAERLQRGKRGKVDNGRILGSFGNAPFGYRFEGNKGERALVVVPDEAQLVQRMFDWFVIEGLSAGKITERLTALRIPTPRDRGRNIVVSNGKRQEKKHRQRQPGQWNSSSVVRILRNAVYIGIVYHYKVKRAGKSTHTTQRDRSEWVGVDVPELAIVDRVLWDRAQAKLDAGQLTSIRNAKHFYLLGHHIVCECGYAMYGKCRGHSSARYYACGGNQTKAVVRCERPSLRAELLEPIVWDWLRGELTPEKIQRGIEAQRTTSADRRQAIAADMAALETQRADVERRRRQDISAFQAEAISLDELKEGKAIHDQAIQSIDTELARLDAELHEAGMSQEQAEGLLAYATELRDELDFLTDDRKRQLLNDVQLKVVLELEPDGSRWADVSCILASDRLFITQIADTSY